MENQQSLNVSKAMEQELIRGRDTANQLLEVVLNTRHGDVEGWPFAEDLVCKVLRSFTNTLILMNTTDDVSDKEVLPITVKDLSPTSCPKLEDTDKAAPKSFFRAKNRRGCSKGKSNAAITWKTDSPILIDDGYVWKKYGQKKIVNVKHPRGYYRCTYKDGEDCPAIKQVQRVQDEPPLYRTTYYGLHTCKSSLNSEMTFEYSNSSSGFLSFNSSNPNKEKSSIPEVIPYYDITHNPLSELHFHYLRHATMLSSNESVPFDDVCGPSFRFD